VTPAQSAEFNTEWLGLDAIWPRADYITVHTPLIPQTKNLLCDATFAKCKKGVKVVNCARGGIIEEAALLRALEAGQCGGAGLDVFCEEPPSDYTLAKHPLVVATPHLGASTLEAQTRVAEEIAQQFIDLRDGKSLFGAINAPALANALHPSTQPWVSLGERLGMVGCVLAKKMTVDSIQVQLSGDCLKTAGSYLVASVMAGFLTTRALDNGSKPLRLNLVNAPVLGKQAGISSVSTFSEACSEARVQVELMGAGQEGMKVCGTVSGSDVKLLSIQSCEFKVAAQLSGDVCIYSLTKETSIADILGAAVKDGAEVRAMSVSEPSGNQGFGVINLARPAKSVAALQALGGVACAVSL